MKVNKNIFSVLFILSGIIVFNLINRPQDTLDELVINDIIHEIPNRIVFKLCKVNQNNLEYYKKVFDNNLLEFKDLQPDSCDSCNYVIYICDSLFQSRDVSKRIKTKLKDTSFIPSCYPVDLLIRNNKSNLKITINDTILSTKYLLKKYSRFDDNYNDFNIKERLDQLYLGKLMFSRVYYNDSNKYGLVFYWYTCGDGGHYGLLLLNKNNNQWHIEENKILGIF